MLDTMFDDTLCCVVSHLSLRDVLSVRATNRNLRDRAGAYAPAYDLCVRATTVAGAADVVAWAAQRLPRATITEIRLRGGDVLTQHAALAAVLRACPAVVALSLRGCTMSGRSGTADLVAAASASRITELRVSDCQFVGPLLDGLAARAGGPRASGLAAVAVDAVGVSQERFCKLIGAATVDAGVCSISQLQVLTADVAPLLQRVDIALLPASAQTAAIQYAVIQFPSLQEIATTLSSWDVRRARFVAPNGHVCVISIEPRATSA